MVHHRVRPWYSLHLLQSLLLTLSLIGVFTELIRKIGVQGVQMEELVTLEDEELNQIK